MSKDQLFKKLREILFEEDDAERRKLWFSINELSKTINTREGLAPRVEPILDEKVVYLQQNFSNLFGPEVTRSIRKQIQESQDEVVEALYPIVGKMIKKYIVREFETLSERIDARLEKAFSFSGLLDRLRGWFSGVKHGDIIASRLLEPRLEEILVIEQNSGILLGSYSRSRTLDQDMTSAMITAIKSFVRDAFDGREDLETIEYETYKLLIRNFRSFYMVAVVSGKIDSQFKSRIDDYMNTAAGKIVSGSPNGRPVVDEKRIAVLLEQYFRD